MSERYNRAPQRIEGEYTDRVRGPNVRYVAQLAPDGRVTHLETRVAVRGRDSSRTVLTLAGDSIRVDQNGSVRWVAGAAGAQVVAGPSGALMEQLLLRARRVGGNPVSLPLFELSERRVRTLTIRWTGDSALASVAGERGVTVFHMPAEGPLLAVRYPDPKGMHIVRR